MSVNTEQASSQNNQNQQQEKRTVTSFEEAFGVTQFDLRVWAEAGYPPVVDNEANEETSRKRALSFCIASFNLMTSKADPSMSRDEWWELVFRVAHEHAMLLNSFPGLSDQSHQVIAAGLRHFDQLI